MPLALKEVANGNDSILSKWVTAFSDPNAFGKFSELQSKAILCYEGKPKTAADTKASLQTQYPDLQLSTLISNVSFAQPGNRKVLQ